MICKYIEKNKVEDENFLQQAFSQVRYRYYSWSPSRRLLLNLRYLTSKQLLKVNKNPRVSRDLLAVALLHKIESEHISSSSPRKDSSKLVRELALSLSLIILTT